MPPTYSHSRLSTFENCPRQYRYRYIDKLPRPGPGIEAHVGICVHKALEFYFGELRAGRPAPSRADLLAVYERTWSATPMAELRIVRNGFDSDDYYLLGRHCLEIYQAGAAESEIGEVLGIEKKIDIRLDESGRYRLIGYIDRFMCGSDGVYEIHDYKTSGSLPRPRDIDQDRQLALYELGVRGELPATAQVRHVWHYLTFGRRFQRVLSRAQLQGFARATMSVIRRVEKETEYAARTQILCHWCDFNAHCPEGRVYLENQPQPGLPVAAR
ncbi:MAG: PD-(D/E)XK nuclease family protein [Acidobacteria bacterium]|nr:PD-(D/E)XK nuclease family protein [Acidobacteriota bacterium]